VRRRFVLIGALQLAVRGQQLGVLVQVIPGPRLQVVGPLLDVPYARGFEEDVLDLQPAHHAVVDGQVLRPGLAANVTPQDALFVVGEANRRFCLLRTSLVCRRFSLTHS